MSWQDDLQPASFRGVPFAVFGGEASFGRRVAAHEYPMRDKPYVEDLGRATRRIRMVGFLVENSLIYGGGPAFGQRDAMVAAAETAGSGTLIHPTLGSLTVSVPPDGLTVRESREFGRGFELQFTFIESGDRVFPSVSQASGSLLGDLANSLGVGAALDFVNSMTASVNLGLGIVNGVISLGHAVVGAVVGVAADVAVVAGQISRDATSLVNLGSLLTGNFGRYANANVTSAFATGQSNSGVGAWTIASLTARGAEDRAVVDTASSALGAAAGALDASSVAAFPASVQTLITAVSACTPNPGDMINRMAALASLDPAVSVASGQIGGGIAVATAATSALVRRAALASISLAVSSYAPSSYDDAAAVRDQVTGYIDAEILIAGDNSDDNSYTALRALRQAVVQALTTSGADLAPLKQYSFKASLPALALSNRIYQDASRSDQLVSQADPIHPAFMPLSFQALSN